ncbi:MAG: hypothetical protein IJQ28_05390 [Clostridia bacterium]|nr:hypothetical protein [Clostridia bacterium]
MIQLTLQQGKVFELFAQGKTMREIALTIGVSYSRIVNILNEILVKSGYKNRRELLINAKSLEYIIM